MASCKECIHYAVCDFDDDEIEYTALCSFFKNRSLFVELPCKVGDPLYIIQQRYTEKGYYSEKRDTFISDCEYCSDGVCDKEFYIKETRFSRLSQIVEYYERYILDSSFEKYRKEFHIKEDAEQSLNGVE